MKGWLTGHWQVRIATAVLLAMAITAAIAPAIVPYDPSAQPDVLALGGLPPSLLHPFGTDQFSRDLFSRTLIGARISLGIAILATAIAILVGSGLGLMAGLGNRWVDTAIMRTVDASAAIPRLVLLIVILSLWGAVNPFVLACILGLTSWFPMSRLVRGEVLSLKTRTFVQASRALGITRMRLVCRHVVPHLMPQIIVAATLSVGNILLIEAGLSYLGLGVPAPGASWGSIIRDGRDLLGTAPWISIFPGLAIALTVVSFSVLGEHLQQLLDPRATKPLRAH